MLVDARKRIVALQAHMDTIKNSLVEQPVSTYDAYRESCGKYQGLKLAVEELKKSETDENDDDV